MATQAATKRMKDGYIPFSVRFKAWWEGLDPNALITKPDEAASNPLAIAIEDEQEDTPKTWPESRLRFCRRLWETGEDDDVVEPGGADYSFWLMKPMSLTSEVSGIDLSAGLGGGTRKTAQTLGTYIDGYELDPELADHAHRLSTKYGMDRQVPVKHLNPDTLVLPERRFNGLLCRERIHRINNKERFLEILYNSLRPRGHMVLTDFVVLQDRDVSAKEISGWLMQEKGSPNLWSAQDYRRALISFGMDVRIEEDETDKYRSMLLQSWARFIAGLSREDLTRDFVSHMMREAEYWLKLIRALESGKLRYYRYHAIRGGESVS